VSAIGQVGDLYVQNRKSVHEYEQAVASGVLPSYQGTHISADDAIRKDVIGRIMCHGVLNIGSLEARHGIVFERYFARELAQLKLLEGDGLIERPPGSIVLTAVGRLLMRNVAMTFDAYLSAAAPGAASKAAPGPMSRVI
jgi:oxygen-independent coproporphyrinogen-3 oxidase